MQALFVVGQPLGSLEIAAKGWKVGMVECWNGGWTFSVFQSSNIPETRPPDITDKLIPEAPIDRPITLADYPGLPVFNQQFSIWPGTRETARSEIAPYPEITAKR